MMKEIFKPNKLSFLSKIKSIKFLSKKSNLLTISNSSYRTLEIEKNVNVNKNLKPKVFVKFFNKIRLKNMLAQIQMKSMKCLKFVKLKTLNN